MNNINRSMDLIPSMELDLATPRATRRFSIGERLADKDIGIVQKKFSIEDDGDLGWSCVMIVVAAAGLAFLGLRAYMMASRFEGNDNSQSLEDDLDYFTADDL